MINEVFTKVESCVLRQKCLGGNIMSATLDPALTALRLMTRGGMCKLKKQNRVSCACFYQKGASGKEKLFLKSTEVGQQDNKDQNLCLRTS